MKYNEVLRNRFEGIKREHSAKESGEDPGTGVPTGLTVFDRRGGHKRGLIHLYAAQTGFGKSLWGMHLAMEAAKRGYRTTLVSMEDPEEVTADRTLASGTLINSEKIGAADLTPAEILRIQMALDDAEEWAELIEIEVGVKTGAEALRIFQEHEADQEILDYLSAFPRGREGREAEISNFMWGWTKHIQSEHRAGIALAQVNNDPSERGQDAVANWRRWNKEKSARPPIDAFRPFDTSELMWCTDAGRNAKSLGYLFRPGKILKMLGHPGAKDDVMEFDFPKRTAGAEGRLRVGLDLKTARFFDLPDKETE